MGKDNSQRWLTQWGRQLTTLAHSMGQTTHNAGSHNGADNSQRWLTQWGRQLTTLAHSMGKTTHKAVPHNGAEVNSQSCPTQWGTRLLHKAGPHNGAEVNSQSCPTQWGTRLLTKLAHTMGCTSTHNAVDVSSQRCLILRSHFLSLTITTRMLRDGFLSNNNDLNAPCHTASTFEVSVVNNGDDGKAVLLCDSQSPHAALFLRPNFFFSPSLAVSDGN